jgi:hypothetical protein
MSKQDLLLKSLDEFFSDEKHFGELSDILNHTSGISLRNIEWFVTNYARTKRTKFVTPSGNTVDIHIAYKSSLGGYSKKFFDPFCRTERIQFKGFTTTVAQLNFIRWCIRNGIIRHIKQEVPRSLYQLKGFGIQNSKDTDSNFGSAVVENSLKI